MPRTASRKARSNAPERIVAAVEQLLAVRSLSDIVVEDILTGAGVSRRTFYQHFRNKDEVVAAIYASVTDAIAAAISGSGFSLDDPLGGIRDAVRSYLNVVDAHQELLAHLMNEALRPDSPLASKRTAFRTKLVATLDVVFAAAFGRRIDPYVFLALVSALEGLCITALAADEPFEPARVETACMCLVEAIAARPASLPAKPEPNRAAGAIAS